MKLKTYNMLLKFLLKEPITSIVSLSLVILLPVFLILLLPIYICRLIAKILAKIFRPDITEILSDNTSLMASWQKDPHCCGNFGFAIRNTKLNLPKVMTVANELLNMPKYRKATQTVTSWMGFYWWKDNPSFCLENQVFVHSERITSEEFDSIRDGKFIENAFKSGKPLWEMHIFENFIPEDSNVSQVMVAFPSHHALLDWYSAIEFVEETSRILGIAVNNNKKTLQTKNAKIAQTVGFYFEILKSVLLAPYKTIKAWIVAMASGVGSYVEGKATKEYFMFEKTVPLDYVRKIAAKNEIRSTVLSFAALTGALRQLLIDLNVNPVPDSVSINLPCPLPWKRTPGFNNHFVVMPIQAPVGEANPFKRLKKVDQQFNNLNSLPKFVGMFASFTVIGGLFHWMIKSFSKSEIRGMSCSMAPGPSNLSEMLDLDITRLIVNGGMPYGDPVLIGFYSISVNGQIIIRVKGDKLLFPSEIESKRFVGSVFKQLKIFDESHG